MGLSKEEKKEKRRRIAHIISGIVILVHAYEKYEGKHHSYLFFAPAGIVFLIIALFHPLIERKFPWVDGVFFVIEGLLSVIVAWEFFHAGKKALPYCYVALAVFQFFMAFRKTRKGIAKHKAGQHTV
ncbi:MAG: hypothetical protein QM737_15965 [Ferruginibacter sp.]